MPGNTVLLLGAGRACNPGSARIPMMLVNKSCFGKLSLSA